jgi:hypothetical protein
MDIIAELESINAAADTGAEILDMALALGQFVARGSDISRAVLGALADTLTIRYNEGTLAEFAKTVGVEARTLRDYRQVVRLLGFGATRRFISGGVPFKVMLHAARYYPEDAAAASAFLATAERYQYSIAEAQRELATRHGQPPRPRVLLDMPVTVSRVDTERGVIVLSDLGDGVWELAGCMGATVMLRVTEAIRDALAAATERAGAAADRGAASVTATAEGA